MNNVLDEIFGVDIGNLIFKHIAADRIRNAFIRYSHYGHVHQEEWVLVRNILKTSGPTMLGYSLGNIHLMLHSSPEVRWEWRHNLPYWHRSIFYDPNYLSNLVYSLLQKWTLSVNLEDLRSIQ